MFSITIIMANQTKDRQLDFSLKGGWLTYLQPLPMQPKNQRNIIQSDGVYESMQQQRTLLKDWREKPFKEFNRFAW